MGSPVICLSKAFPFNPNLEIVEIYYDPDDSNIGFL